jgi:hypothetical protein
MDWAKVHRDSAARIRRGALRRLAAVSAIVLLFLGVGAGLWLSGAVAPLWLGLFTAVPALVAVAFGREALSNLSDDPVVLLGTVGARGPAVTNQVSDADVGTGASRVLRVVFQTEEAFELSASGERRPRPDLVAAHTIDQPGWYRELKPGERTALVCPSRSLDPVMKVPV